MGGFIFICARFSDFRGARGRLSGGPLRSRPSTLTSYQGDGRNRSCSCLNMSMARALLSFLAVSVLVSPTSLLHAGNPPIAKAYAVFLISYNRHTDQVIGGVAGTAFFVSDRKAITAFHVLRPESFTPEAGYEFRRVYLLHEGAPPIALNATEVTFQPDRDQSEIELPTTKRADPRYIFTKADRSLASGPVLTEGFLANTAGPELARVDGHITVTRVRKLARARLTGDLVRRATVTLAASDVSLRDVPCLQLSYRPIVGFSGGPVMDLDGRVLGMNSFAEPSTQARTWAVSL